MAKTATLTAIYSRQHYSQSNLTANFNALNNNFSNFLHIGGVTESGNTMLGNLDMGSLSIVNVATPSLASSAANKAYVDAQLADIALGSLSITFDLINVDDISFVDGTAALPSIHFTNDADTGFYRPGADQLSAVVGGVAKLDITSAGIVAPTIVGGTLSGTFSGNHTKSGVLTLSNTAEAATAGSGAVILSGGLSTAKSIYMEGTLRGEGNSNRAHILETEGFNTLNLRSFNSANSAIYILSSANGTIASPTTKVAGEIIGQIRFDAHDGTSMLLQQALIRVIADNTISTGQVPTYMQFYTNSTGTATQALQLDKNQNVHCFSNLGVNTDGGAFHSSMIGGIAVVNGTAPTAIKADAFALYSADWNGAGTAVPHIYDEEGLSGPLVKTTSGEAINIKYVDIGDWNMDTTATVSVAHGIADATKIRSVEAYIYSDSGASLNTINTINGSETSEQGARAEATNVVLARGTSGFFDSTNYDSTSYNRGHIRIEYTN